jgi:hypothetical protein
LIGSILISQYPDYVVERETNMTTDMTNYKTSELAQSVDVDDYAVMVQEIADREVTLWIDSILRKVAELPGRDSPEDKPDLMLVSDNELRAILEDACEEINLTIE